MASLKLVKERMRSVTNIRKITKAMKMVSASKLRHDTLRYEMGLPFADPVIEFFDRIPTDTRTTKPLTICSIAGDKGLCGGINSAVVKATRLAIQSNEAAGSQTSFFGVGKKVPAGLKRVYGDRFAITVEDLTKSHTNYSQTCAVAERLSGLDPERLSFVSNKQVSLVAYETVEKAAPTRKWVEEIDKLEWSKAVDSYSFEPGKTECWDDLHDFFYSCSVYVKQLDGQAAEQAARMAAMENASKNAGEMLEKLTLRYNRARQARITTELCEIISGASAL